MPDQLPGFELIRETEEVQIFGTGPDNQHQRFETKVHIKSTVTDSGNTPTTTIRGGTILARRTSDGLDYIYSPTANDGTQCPIGVLPSHTSMLDRYGSPVDKVKNIVKGGLLKSTSDLVNPDLMALAVLLRSGFHLMSAKPHGSAFLYHPVSRDRVTSNYTITADDHGKMIVVAGTSATTLTLPNLASVGPGFEVLIFNEVNQNLTIAGATGSIVYGASGNSTNLIFNTASNLIGASVLMRSDYDNSGNLRWYPLQIQRTVSVS